MPRGTRYISSTIFEDHPPCREKRFAKPCNIQQSHAVTSQKIPPPPPPPPLAIQRTRQNFPNFAKRLPPPPIAHQKKKKTRNKNIPFSFRHAPGTAGSSQIKDVCSCSYHVWTRFSCKEPTRVKKRPKLLEEHPSPLVSVHAFRGDHQQDGWWGPVSNVPGAVLTPRLTLFRNKCKEIPLDTTHLCRRTIICSRSQTANFHHTKRKYNPSFTQPSLRRKSRRSTPLGDDKKKKNASAKPIPPPPLFNSIFFVGVQRQARVLAAPYVFHKYI